MTLTETLERLAVVAPDSFKIEPGSGIVYVFRRDSWRKATKVGTLDPDLIFGACCEKVESEGWMHQHMYHAGSWRFKVSIDGNWTYRDSVQSLAHAAATALLAALEGRVEKCAKCDAGYIEKGLTHKECPECQGSGEKQEVRA